MARMWLKKFMPGQFLLQARNRFLLHQGILSRVGKHLSSAECRSPAQILRMSIVNWSMVRHLAMTLFAIPEKGRTHSEINWTNPLFFYIALVSSFSWTSVGDGPETNFTIAYSQYSIESTSSSASGDFQCEALDLVISKWSQCGPPSRFCCARLVAFIR